MAKRIKRSKASKRDWHLYRQCVQGDFDDLLSDIEKTSKPQLAITFAGCDGNNQPLHFAAAYGNLNVVRTLIEKYRHDAECTNDDLVTPLHVASFGGHHSVVEYLLTKCHCNPNVKDTHSQSSPLHYVCSSMMFDEVQLFNRHDTGFTHSQCIEILKPVEKLMMAPIKPHYSACRTTLSLVKQIISDDHMKVAKSLIVNGSEPFMQNAFGQAPMLLELACKCGCLEDVNYLIDSVQVELKENMSLLLCIACKYKQTEIKHFLLEKCITNGMELCNTHVLMIACSIGNMTIIKHLIEHNIACPTIESLLCAADNKADISVLTYLASNVANGCYNPMEFYCIRRSVRDEELGLYTSSTGRMSEFDLGPTCVFLYLLLTNHFDLMRVLVNHKNVINMDSEGNTPLHLACTWENSQFVEFLVGLDKEKVTTKMANKKGELPIHCACRKGNNKIIKLVSPHGDHVNAQDCYGNTPMHVACMNKSVSIIDTIRYLVEELKCSQNICNNGNELPIHTFCKHQCSGNERRKEEAVITEILELISIQLTCNINAQDSLGQTPLHILCEDIKNIELVQFLTQKKVCDQNIQNNEGQLPLHIVINLCRKFSTCEPDHETKCTKFMLMVEMVSSQSTLNVNAQDCNGNTPLHIACEYNHMEIVKYLVFKKNCFPQKHTKIYANLEIHLACSERDTALLQRMATKENVNKIARHQETALHVACKYDNTAAVQLLTQMGCDQTIKNCKGELPLHVACHKASLTIVKMVAECDVNCVNCNGETPLHIACTAQDIEKVKFLIENKHCDPSKKSRDDDTALHFACRSGATDVAAHLLEGGYCSAWETNHMQQLPLHVACTKSLELVKMTSQRFTSEQLNKSVTLRRLSPLHIACSHGLLGVVKYLIKRGCSPFEKDSYGIDALGNACGLNSMASEILTLHNNNAFSNVDEDVHPKVVRYLITECDLDPVKPQSGWRSTLSPHHVARCPSSLLEHAVKINHLELLKALTVLNVNCIDDKGNTPLHFACKYRQKEMVEYLISQECDQTIQNHKSELALHLACSQSVEIVKMLKFCHSDIQKQNYSGDTALHIACRREMVDIVQYLVMERKCNTSIPNCHGELPLHIVCQLSTANSFELCLLKCLVDANLHDATVPDNKGKSPIHVACELNKFDSLQLLVSQENINSVDAEGNTALHIACKHKNLKLIRWLVEHNADVYIQNSNGDTPLHISIKCFSESVNAVIALLCNTPVGREMVQNDGGDLPFSVSRSEKKECVTYLSAKTCTEDLRLIQNLEGDTPLHIAARVSASKHIFKTVSRHENCNIQNKQRATAMHEVCMSSHDKFVTRLLQLHCDIKIVNNRGRLPLHIAAMHSNVPLINKLLLGQNLITMISSQDEDGNTPLHLACLYGNFQVVQHFFNLRNAQTTSPVQVSVTMQQTLNDCTETSVSHSPFTLVNANGDTLMHLACRSGNVKLVQYLAENKLWNFTLKNVCEETPLHIACSKSNLEMVELVSECDSLCQVLVDVSYKLIQPDDTPLHIACRAGSKDIVQHLLQNCGARKAMSIPNAQNELPIHLACTIPPFYSESKCLDLMKVVIKLSKAYGDKQTKNGDTVLHMACRLPSNTKILTYLMKEVRCNVTIPNGNGDLPLHLLCRHAKPEDELLSSIKILINNCQPQSPLCAQNKLGNTPLHEVCSRISDEHYSVEKREQVIQYLLDNGSNERSPNNLGETPLHLACRNQTLPIVKCLQKGEVGIKHASNGNTLIHQACLNKHGIDILMHIFKTTNDLSLNSVNADKETPLHLACKTNNSEIVKFLLSKDAVVSNADVHDQTPITHATDPAILNLLLEHGADPTPLYGIYQNFFQQATSSGAPPPTPLKVLVIGDPGAGKTTLVQSLKNEDGENIAQIEPFGHTAGVIPNDFSSQIYGEVTMYDFAGHSEYYPSHGGVIHSIIKNSPPVILMLVKLTRNISEIRDRALYWTKFVLNYCASLEGKPHLIVIGSHADVLEGKGENPSTKTKALLKMLKTKMNIKPVIVKSALNIDCTQSQSLEINELRKELQESSSELKEKTVLHFSSHCLYVFLQRQFHDRPAVTLDYLLSTIILSRHGILNSDNSSSKLSNAPISVLPTEPATVSHMCEELSERGHLLFIKHPRASQIKLSWIILKKDVILHEVVGCLFAPPDFPQHISLATSTGVVPFSKLKLLQYDPNLLTGFLTHMEYCQEIFDPETLQLLDEERKCVQNSLDEKYFFFPTLVSIERPSELWKQNKPSFTYQCGLILECEEQEDFFNPQFIQVLLLRLAFTYAAKPTRMKKRVDCISVHDMAEKRVCTVWNCGIHWLDRHGIETLVDVIDNDKILILMQCLNPLNIKLKCLKRRSSILSTILTTKKKLCPGPQITQYLLHPKSIQHPLPPLSKLSYFTVDDIKSTIEESEATLLINDDGEGLEQNELLFFEPYACLCKTIVDGLYNSVSSDLEKVVPDDFLHHMCYHLLPCYDHIVELIKPTHSYVGSSASNSPSESIDKLFQMFKKWQRRQPQKAGGTFVELCDLLNEVSLFPALGLTPTGASCIINQENSELEETKAHGYLSIDDFKSVQMAIWDIRAEWQNLGVQLDLGLPLLAVIKEDCHEADKCFNKMLASWLDREDPQPTWFAMVEALKSPVIHNPQLAQKLEEKYIQKHSSRVEDTR